MFPSPWMSRIAKVATVGAFLYILVTGIMDATQGRLDIVLFLGFLFISVILVCTAFVFKGGRDKEEGDMR